MFVFPRDHRGDVPDRPLGSVAISVQQDLDQNEKLSSALLRRSGFGEALRLFPMAVIAILSAMLWLAVQDIT